MNILIMGNPGCGKTTLIKKMLPRLHGVSGFITEELRRNGVRVGFSIETLDGFRGTLAHRDFHSPIRVGKYGVNLPDLEESCRHVGKGIVVIDEIGKMELHSEIFRNLVLKILRENRLLATIMHAPHPFCDMIRSRDDVSLFLLTEENREEVSTTLKEILAQFS